MEDINNPKLLRLVKRLNTETLKYVEGKSTEKKIINILKKISTVIEPLPVGEKAVLNRTKIKENMEIISKLLIIAYEVLKHFIDH